MQGPRFNKTTHESFIAQVYHNKNWLKQCDQTLEYAMHSVITSKKLADVQNAKLTPKSNHWVLPLNDDNNNKHLINYNHKNTSKAHSKISTSILS